MQKKIVLIYLIAILLGVLTGFFGSLLQLAIAGINNLLTHFFAYAKAHGVSPEITSAITTMVMVLIAFLMVRFIANEASGSGVQEIEGALLHERPVFWKRLLPVKFIGGVLAISSKMVLGREGPTIQFGGNLGDMLGDLLGLNRQRRDALIAAGAAAGLATAFNAPLAGVLFVIEEMRNEFNFTFVNFKMVAICCVAATIVLRLIMGNIPDIPMNIFHPPSMDSLWLFFFFGIFVGFVGLFFNIGLMKLLYLTDKFPAFVKYLFVIAISLLVGFFAYSHPDFVGGGYVIIEKTLTLDPPIEMLGIVLLVRFFMTLFCYSTGVPGGIFAPMLALGTLLGLGASWVFSHFSVDPTIHPGMFAVAGMGALFAAAVRAPVTGILLVVEMTQNYLLILPIMVTCLTSTTIVQLARNKPIYTQLLQRTLKKAKLAHGEE